MPLRGSRDTSLLGDNGLKLAKGQILVDIEGQDDGWGLGLGVNAAEISVVMIPRNLLRDNSNFHCFSQKSRTAKEENGVEKIGMKTRIAPSTRSQYIFQRWGSCKLLSRMEM